MSFKNYSKIAVLSLAGAFAAMTHADTDLNTPEAYKTCYPTGNNIAEIMKNEYHLPNETPVNGEGFRVFEGDKLMLAMTRDFAATATHPAQTCIVSVRVAHTDAEGQKLWATVRDRPLKW